MKALHTFGYSYYHVIVHIYCITLYKSRLSTTEKNTILQNAPHVHTKTRISLQAVVLYSNFFIFYIDYVIPGTCRWKGVIHA